VAFPNQGWAVPLVGQGAIESLNWVHGEPLDANGAQCWLDVLGDDDAVGILVLRAHGLRHLFLEPDVEQIAHRHVRGLEERPPLALFDGAGTFALGLNFGGVDPDRLQIARAGCRVINPEADPPIEMLPC
jgi:hypothetical protein